MGEMSHFALFEALNGAFEVHFFAGLHFLHLIKDTDVACRAAQLRFLKVETLFKNVFKASFI